MLSRRLGTGPFEALFICLVLQLVCCYGFVLMTSGTRFFETQVFEPGGSWTYSLQSTLLLNEKGGTKAKDVGFYISSSVTIDSIWGGQNYERLLKVQIDKPKLNIRSRKTPSPEGFVEHNSLLDSMQNKPFYIKWNRGKIEGLWIRKGEPIAMANLKKGVASLLQFQVMDQEHVEVDASGHCMVSYNSPNANSVIKTKSSCTSPDLLLLRNTKPLLDTRVISQMSTSYEFGDGHIISLISTEKHEMSAAFKEDVGNEALIKQEMNFVKSTAASKVGASNFEDLREYLEKKDGGFEDHTLLTQPEYMGSDESRSFPDLVKANRNNLKNKQLGNLASAKSFVELVRVARYSKLDDISKAIGDRGNVEIMTQIYDILGFVQTSDSHAAAMKKLHFDKGDQRDLAERYLWALSACSQPNPEILVDLLGKYKKTKNIPESVKETIILSVASMAYHLDQKLESNKKVYKDVETTILNNLDAAKGDSRHPFLRALQNLRSKHAAPILIKIANKGSLKEGVLAWKALQALEKGQVEHDVLKAAVNTYFQLDKIHDSTSRTIALDVLLKNDPTEEVLADILKFLQNDDNPGELKKFTEESLNMRSEADHAFGERLRKVFLDNCQVFNFYSYPQRGMSMALVRQFMQGEHSNGSLYTTQEITKGMVKRGLVNAILVKDGVPQEIFTVAIFAGGLANILASNGDDTEEYATAGMELGVVGTQIRPFVFFTGQGELMGHVWSGTASERTTAFQALSMLQDHLQYLRLGSGFIAELDLKGCGSFDLSGHVQISLWNRNAESLVEKAAGLFAIGMMKIDSTFVRSQIEFTMAIEPKLRLETNIDFSNDIAMCIRLNQPETIYRHSVYKIERIPGSKHRLRIKRSKKCPIAGKTYALNQKTSETCRSTYR